MVFFCIFCLPKNKKNDNIYRREKSKPFYLHGGVNMSKVCAICGKGKMSGNLVSHSNRKTPRTYSANLKKVKVEINGKESTEYVCTRCIRTANKED